MYIPYLLNSDNFSNSHFSQCTTAVSHTSILYKIREYSIGGTFGGQLYLVIWQSAFVTAKYKSTLPNSCKCMYQRTQLYLMRNGQARRTHKVTSMNLIPAREKGGQVQAIRLSIVAASSSLRYIWVCVFKAQHTCTYIRNSKTQNKCANKQQLHVELKLDYNRFKGLINKLLNNHLHQ
jgi:hypothetical protein